jgi:hypothetical protein
VLEGQLRSLARLHLSQINTNRATYWRHRAKIRHCTLGDEKSCYFHLCASARLRKNQIKVLDNDAGDSAFSHMAKATILHYFLKDLLGTPFPLLLPLTLHP